jgi:tripartite-type tricarboxylate transporter receptor subunit TctC
MMQDFVRRVAAVCPTALLAACCATIAHAQTPEQFYKGRQLTMIVYSGTGSAYDFYARLLVRHMVNHIPGKPTFIVQNMQGAGGLKAIEYLYRIAPKDGSVMGTIGRGLAFEPVLGKNEIRYDPLQFTWLGSMNREATLAMSWHTSKVKTYEDLKKTELLVPGTGAGADSEIIPLAFNSLAGTKFKIIAGYKDTTDGALAMERGELDGLAYWSWSAVVAAHPDWVPEKKINVLFHTGTEVIPEIRDVPLIRNLVTNPTDKKALEFMLAREILGRPFLAPPALPADRAAVLRAAFVATLRDPEFIKDAKRSNLETNLVPGEEVDAVLKEATNAPPEVIKRVKESLERK